MNSRSVSRREAKANRDGFLFSLPWLIGFLLFSLYPIVMSAYYSFTDFSAIKDPVWVGLKNYQDLLKDKLFWQSLQNTILYVVISVPVTILVSLLLAALLKVVRVGKAFFRSVFFLPSIFPVVASTMIWLLILDSISGYLNRFLNLFGLPSVNWLGNPVWTKPALVIMTCWGVGSTVVILLAAMGDVSHELYEAASIDGAGTWKQFIHITLPGISHVLVYQVILAVINGFQYFTQVYILCSAQSGNLSAGVGAGKKNSLLMYPLYLFQNAFGRLKMGSASAMAWILFVIVLILTLILLKGSDKYVDVK
ncbi:MAG: sugar ABC transporter permease [Lachnospiraceae bacterium]|nr:sugar ABC transporter permease [Lachnospiraceae bacterium]MBF1001953.1 sugar ABC transporter permease [Lachnospiraceae bacterium]